MATSWLLYCNASPKSVVSALKLFMASFAAMASMGLLALGRLYGGRVGLGMVATGALMARSAA